MGGIELFKKAFTGYTEREKIAGLLLIGQCSERGIS